MDDVSLKIVVRCADLDGSRRFYADVLGLSVVDEWEEPHGNGCVLSFGSAFIELREEARGGSREESASQVDILLQVPDLDAWIDRIDGRWEHGDPKVQPWGERTVRLHDPDGILLTIYQTLD